MTECRACGREYDDGHLVCPADGERLREVDAPARRTDVVVANPLRVSEPAARYPLGPGVAIGEYVVEERIARGGMGAVYAARHPVLGRRAAIKVIRADRDRDPELISRLVREAQAVNLIRHPNIVDIYSIGTLPDGRGYLVMDWLDGETLSARIRARGRLPVAETSRLLAQVASAVEAAHAAGVVHRDLKPGNIFIESAGDVAKVLDFGIARVAGDGVGTASGVLLGTPAYLAPEQARSSRVDHRADIYSLGVVLFQALSGRLPFPGRSRLTFLEKHVGAPPPSLVEQLAGLPRELDEMIRRMLAKERGDRPALAEVRALLARHAEEEEGSSPPRRAEVPSGPPVPFDESEQSSQPMTRLERPARDRRQVAGESGTFAAPRAPDRPATEHAHRDAESSGALYARPVHRRPLRALAPVAALMAVAGLIALFWSWIGTGSASVKEQVAAPVEKAQGAEPKAAVVTEPLVAPLAGGDPADTKAARQVGGGAGEAAPELSDEPLPREPDGDAPEIAVAVDVAGATILIDGEVIAASVRRAVARVEPGEHEVVVRAKGHPTFRKKVHAGPRARVTVEASLADRKPARALPRKETPEELAARVRQLYQETAALGAQPFHEGDEASRALRQELLLIPSPFRTSDPDRLRAIERKLRRLRARLDRARSD